MSLELKRVIPVDNDENEIIQNELKKNKPENTPEVKQVKDNVSKES